MSCLFPTEKSNALHPTKSKAGFVERRSFARLVYPKTGSSSSRQRVSPPPRRSPRNTATNAGTMGNDFVLIDPDTNEPLDGSMASGYPVAIDQFKELCPTRVR